MNRLANQPYAEVIVGLVVLAVLLALVLAILMANTIELNLGFVKLRIHKSRRPGRQRK